ncbi:DsbA family oxidoreductase [Nocardioides sambongensis]|uniref:DsbA family oxidoreductase n=1 Tax=Nocardioides sambongensis TaxID=2589074 RepID=UPI001126B35E|nr:DsbA family oxidoreductase [Nocardioides sambongensis]
MRIDIWSDVACPWCSIGKKRLDRALADFEHADEVEVVYHSYQLDPSAPAEPTERARDMLARKYRMSAAQAAQAQDRVTALAAEEGMFWRHDETWHVSTADAHRLLHLALAESGPQTQARLKEALWQAHFGEARNVADPAVLTELALGVGLDADRVAAVLGSNEFADAVEDDIRRAASLGATGVPFFVVDEKFGISGAQPVELFAQALERAWAERTPLQMVAADAGEDAACGPDGCAI